MIEWKPKQTKLEKLRWKVLMAKLTTQMWVSEKKRRLKQKLFCSKGYHKIGACSISRHNHPRGDFKVEYFCCDICETKWFRSIEDKNNYQRFHESGLQNWYFKYREEEKRLAEK